MFFVLAQNVEHFRGRSSKVAEVVQSVKHQDPDIFGIFESEGVDVLDLTQNHFPEYDFNITDGRQQIETIVAHCHGKFSQLAFTQKREFKAFNPSLQPGALHTVKYYDYCCNVLYLHTDSGAEAPDFGNRKEMFAKIIKLNGNERDKFIETISDHCSMYLQVQ